MRTWLLIDCPNLLARAFYAHPAMVVGGQQTGAIYGFLAQVLKLREEYNSTGIVFAFDGDELLRRKIYPEYKNKPVRPTDIGKDRRHLVRQSWVLRTSTLRRLGFKNVITKNGYEADDVLAAVADSGRIKRGVIVSSDKDLYQCLSDGKPLITIHDLGRKAEYTQSEFDRDYGITPDLWPKVKAIAGCASDYIKGVSLVGEKTAIRYLKKELGEKTQAWQSITKAEARISQNLRLVSLPYPGLTLPEFKEDEDDLDSWRSVLSEINATRLLRG